MKKREVGVSVNLPPLACANRRAHLLLNKKKKCIKINVIDFFNNIIYYLVNIPRQKSLNILEIFRTW
jgi:hypothetical protein